MTITVQLPDGSTAQFPDGTSREAMKAAIQKRFPPTSVAPMSNSERTRQARGMTDADVQGRIATANEQGADMEATLRDRGAVNAMAQGANQGLTFGFGDEITAGLGAGIHAMTGAAMPYDEGLELARKNLDMARRERPVAAYGAEIGAGALAGGGLAGATVGAGKTVLGMAGRGSAAGAAEGAMYGFGSGEGGMGSRAVNAAQGAALGGAVGGAAPIIVAGGRAAYNGAANPIRTALNISSPAKASRAIETAMRRSGLDATKLDDALKSAGREGQPEYMLADALGNPGQRMLSGVARQPGDMRREIVETLMRRQHGQGNRLAGFVEEGMGFDGQPRPTQGTNMVVRGHRFADSPSDVLARGTTSAHRLTRDLTSARTATADIAYDASRMGAKPVDTRTVIGSIDERLSGTSGNEFARDEVDNLFQKWRDRLAATGPEGDVSLSDYDRLLRMKRSMQDDIDTLSREGKNYAASELDAIKHQLDAALEDASVGYRKANDGFREASGVIDAVERGQEMFRPGARATDNVAAVKGMTPDQAGAARIGYGDKMLAQIDGAAPGVNKAPPLRSAKAQTELGAMAQNPALLGRRIERENTMFETGAQALGGSRTADNLADTDEVAGLTAPILANLLAGRFPAVATQLGQKAMNATTGNSEATRALIAKMLLSKDVQAALAPAQRAAIKSGKVSQVVEALMRSGSLRAIGQ